MFIAPADATRGEGEWRPFLESHPFGHLVAPGGADATPPVVVPTQFVLEGDTVWLHLVRANPVFDALAENPRVVLSVADDWAFIPSSWKAIGGEDPTLGIPTTYYGAVQLVGRATVHDERTDPGRWRASCGGNWRRTRQVRRWRTRRRRTRRSCWGSSGSRSRSSLWQPSSSTAATSTRPIGAPSSSDWASVMARATLRRLRTSCAG